MCKEHKTCIEVCDMVDFSAGGNVSIKEKPIKINDRHINRDYKESLNIDIGNPITITEIRQIPDIPKRAIASMLHARISMQEIPSLMRLSKRRVYQIIERVRRY